MKKIDYTEVNLDEQPDQRDYVMKLSGSATVPVVVAEDTENNEKSISIGYKPAQLATMAA